MNKSDNFLPPAAHISIWSQWKTTVMMKKLIEFQTFCQIIVKVIFKFIQYFKHSPKNTSKIKSNKNIIKIGFCSPPIWKKKSRLVRCNQITPLDLSCRLENIFYPIELHCVAFFIGYYLNGKRTTRGKDDWVEIDVILWMKGVNEHLSIAQFPIRKYKEGLPLLLFAIFSSFFLIKIDNKNFLFSFQLFYDPSQFSWEIDYNTKQYQNNATFLFLLFRFHHKQ